MPLKVCGPCCRDVARNHLRLWPAFAVRRYLSTSTPAVQLGPTKVHSPLERPASALKTPAQLTQLFIRKHMTTSSTRSNMNADEYIVDKLTPADFDEWSALFRAYIDFYQSSLPDEQYRKTFERILDDTTDLYALVMRENKEGGGGRMVGIAHFFPQQSPWSEKKIMHFNDLFVDPSLRGKGAGRRMINAVADVARDMGCLRVQWMTKHDNTIARRLYDTLAECSFVQYRMSLYD